MKLEDYETRMVHDGKRNNREVKIKCEVCGTEKWLRWQRVRQGRGRFCSMNCVGISQRKWGKENAYFYFDRIKGRTIARWRDAETGETRISHKSRFIWEAEHGEIPDGYDIHHKDGDVINDEIDNLEVVEGHLHKQGIHGSNRMVIGGVVHKQCFKCKKYYVEAEFTQSYCTSCYAEYMREYRSKLK